MKIIILLRRFLDCEDFNAIVFVALAVVVIFVLYFASGTWLP